MCLAIPGKIVEIINNEFALIEVSGIQREVSTTLIDEIKLGDYVIIHQGYALSKLDEMEAKQTLELFNKIAES